MEPTRTQSVTSKHAAIYWLRVIRIGVPYLLAICAPFYFTWSGLIAAIVLYAATGFGITLGYHRLHTHRSFKTFRVVDYFLAFMGTLADEGGVIEWVTTHRAHHAFSDTNGDPHSPTKGFMWAQYYWLIFHNPETESPEAKSQYSKDLLRVRFYRLLDGWPTTIYALSLVAICVIGESLFDCGLSWLTWAGGVRTVAVLNSTWLVNSVTHISGYSSHETGDSSTNNWWVALLTLGEGWHNNHHAFPTSARHGLAWWEFDPTWIAIKCMSKVGLAWDVKLPRSEEAPAGVTVN
ncbi:MAG TPA: fatty acid desaturase [Pirellulales bacterium]|jgi:stearoyl-CoA desaturase (delta-9 desaturase)|nr:fatty acid desaturase [Pirellulales bacterium]